MQSALFLTLLASSVVSPFSTSSSPSPTQIVGSVIERLGPVRDQGDSDVCFGSAGADIATFQSGERVSDFSVTVRNFQMRKGWDYLFFNPIGMISSNAGAGSRYRIGLASTTLDAIRQTTLCADDQVNGYTYFDADLKQFWDLYQNQYRPYYGATAPMELYDQIRKSLHRIVPSLDAEDFMSHISRFAPLDFALGEWFDRNCRIHLPSALRVVGGEPLLHNPDQVMADLDSALISGQPAMIHYSPTLLDGRKPALFDGVIGSHVSVVVAKAEIQGVLHYLVRNSWGPSCQNYSAEIAGRCDRGHLWITESEMRRYITSVSYLAPA